MFYVWIAMYVIAAIFSIILFVKVWKMTNDVRELKNKFVFETKRTVEIDRETLEQIRSNFLLGNVDYVKTLLINAFCNRIESSVRGIDGKVNTNNYPKSIRKYVEMLERQFEKIGEKLPESIAKMETFGDYFNMFTEDDFKLK